MKSTIYKTPAESETIKTEVVCPDDTNPMEVLKGGRLVEWMDVAAAICAQTHTGKICVTASINKADFYAAAKAGDIISIFAKITRAFNASMEIYVSAFARKVLGGKNYLISEAYFTFVAIDENGKTTPAMVVKPVSSFEKKQYAAALYRKKKNILTKRKSERPRYAEKGN
jgi:acyl-CoA hydrolase